MYRSNYSSPSPGLRSHPCNNRSDPRINTAKRHRNDSGKTSDYGSDVECSKKDEMIRHYKEQIKDCEIKNKEYKEKLQRFDDVSKNQKTRIEELENKDKDNSNNVKELINQIQDLSKERVEYQKKCKGIDSYAKEMSDKVKTREVERNEALKEVDRLRAQLDDKQKTTDGLNKGMVDKNKALESTVQQMKTEISALNKKLREKDIALQGLGENMDTIEKLENENIIKGQNLKKYKEKYEKVKSQIADTDKLKAEISRMKREITSLKGQRGYFNNQNENNKRKSVAVTSTQIKQKALYSQTYRKMGKHVLESNQNNFNLILKFVTDLMQSTESQSLKFLAESVKGIQDGNEKIEEQEKQILQKRADGRVNCGSCNKDFACTGDMTHHMTKTHKICTTDRSKNDYETITLD